MATSVLIRLKWKHLADTSTVIDFRMVNASSWLVLWLYPYIVAFAATSLIGITLSCVWIPRTRR